MAKKIVVDQIDPDDPREDKQLVAKVDEMMATEAEVNDKPKEQPPKPAPIKLKIPIETDTHSGPALDIFNDTPSAPLLAGSDSSTAPEDSPKKESDKPEPAKEEPETPKQDQDSITPDEPSFSDDQGPLKIHPPARPDNYDDRETAKVINDIVAHESDDVLAVEDQRLAKQQETGRNPKPPHTHKLIWSFVTLICLLAIATAVFILDPNLLNPFSKLHWSSISKHL